MIRLVRFTWLAVFLFLILVAGCNKDSDNFVHLDTIVRVKVTDKLGTPMPNAEVRIYSRPLRTSLSIVIQYFNQ